MGIWKAKILSSKKGETGVFEADLAKHLNLGWNIEGYSVEDRFHFALLVKETKEDKD